MDDASLFRLPLCESTRHPFFRQALLFFYCSCEVYTPHNAQNDDCAAVALYPQRQPRTSFIRPRCLAPSNLRGLPTTDSSDRGFPPSGKTKSTSTCSRYRQVGDLLFLDPIDCLSVAQAFRCGEDSPMPAKLYLTQRDPAALANGPLLAPEGLWLVFSFFNFQLRRDRSLFRVLHACGFFFLTKKANHT